MSTSSHKALAALLSTAANRTTTVKESDFLTNLASLLPTTGHDWESLISLASAETVLPALNESANYFGSELNLPTEITDCFSAVTELNRERNTVILSELCNITAALNNAGIEPVVLKGLAYLLTGTYSDPGARYVSDIDLLVPADQLQTAMEVLQTYAYQPDNSDPVARFRHHLPTLSRPGNLPVELHHSVGLGICQKLLPAADLVRDSSLLTWNGVRLRVPSPNHLITHLVIHSQLLHPYVERIWPPLKALYDLALLQHRFGASISWASITQRFRSQSQYATLALHLLQAEQSLHIPRPTHLPLTFFTRLRWTRRQLLRRFPHFRYVDPFYLSYSFFSRRARVLYGMLVSGAWKQVLKRVLQPGLYRALNSELTRS